MLHSYAICIHLAVLLPFLFGCSDDLKNNVPTPDVGVSARCGAGMKEVKTACVPMFDDCKDNEVPVLGGGCKRVGVDECQGGLIMPPDWKCKRVGPSTTCTAGWTRTKDGVCEPLLPAAACQKGEMAVLGKATCQPIMACGSGTYGNIKTTSATLHVDAASSSSTPDGSLAAPYKTLHMALHGAQAGAHIALAAGTYKSDVYLDKAVTIDGRCPELVTIQNATSKYNATIVISGTNATIRGVTVSGDQRGVNVYETSKAMLEQVVIEGHKSKGIYAIYADLTVRDSLISGSVNDGIKAYGASVLIERSVVQATTSDMTKKYGYGVSGNFSSIFNKPATLTITDSLIKGNTVAGVILFNSSATITRTVINKTRPRGLDSDAGTGITVFTQPYPTGYTGKKDGSVLMLKDSVLADNSFGGIDISSGTATVSNTVIRDSPGSPGSLLHNGAGITVSGLSGLAAKLKLTDSLLLRNYCDGVGMIFGTAEITGTRIEDTRLCKDGTGGRGLSLQTNPDLKIPTEATVKESIISGNFSFGVATTSGTVTMERTLVKGTLPRTATGERGVGVEVNAFHTMPHGSTVTLRDCKVATNRYAGIHCLWSTLSVERTIISGTTPQKSNNRHGYGIAAYPYNDKGSTVTVKDSLISANQSVGILIAESTLTLEGSRVEKTVSDFTHKGLGDGIYSDGGQVTISNTLVQNNQSSAVAIKDGTQNTITRSALVSTNKDGNSVHGSGITVIEIKKKAAVTVKDNLLKSNALAGIVFFGGSGTIARSLFQSNDFSIALDSGASPVISEDNVYSGNKRDAPSFGVNLKQPAVPSAPEIGPSTK